MLTTSAEEHRTRLRAVAYRLLGADDANGVDDVHEVHEVHEVHDDAVEADEVLRAAAPRLTGTPADRDVVARACLERLRAREVRRGRRDPRDRQGRRRHRQVMERPGPGAAEEAALDALTPSERVAFVLHDAFAVPYEEIAPVVERTPAAARQLVARARRRVEGTEEMPEPDPARQREVVTALLAAAGNGDTEALRALLDPDVVLRSGPGAPAHVSAHGATAVARALADRLDGARPVLVDGAPGLARPGPDGKPAEVFDFTVLDDRVTAVDLLDAEHDDLGGLDLRPLDGATAFGPSSP
ncbi:sigma factor-like helix-turn-helix DNA-binding protein [Streptomyces sp. NPDC006339]|uniref:sigma factor-like helix-turn-helix DNA-binding protein n=1 Tax=Streptomyces sp. NPDC006339 TaxID=3156755 RepID=UPI0033A56A3E